MTGKIAALAILISAIAAGVSLYYLQIYGFYEEATAELTEVRLVSLNTDTPEPISARAIQAIDAESSPIRFRACFETDASLPMLTETYVAPARATPRNAPPWFDCFDAADIAAEIAAGTALPFLGQKNVKFGVDRIVVITDDGRGYIWHELNDCGEKAYDGTIVGEECPGREGS
ncbi:DUF6446 family protein [uncultured Roseobacter sp.]|uniref:DUF6446 family protein n=1 Tax=uncultured Roseobacter sp. TaxID=114847 RepID=UPI002635A2B8|nr:DUF6446 family protein [uncultured Roseobacter sp.]